MPGWTARCSRRLAAWALPAWALWLCGCGLGDYPVGCQADRACSAPTGGCGLWRQVCQPSGAFAPCAPYQTGGARSCPVAGQQGACAVGEQTCQPDGTYGACQQRVQPASEQCNGVDDDCDGVVDNGFELIFTDPDSGAVKMLPVGAACAAGPGVCRRAGTVTCRSLRSSGCSAISASPPPPSAYPTNPPTAAYVGDPAVQQPWDWDCDGKVTVQVCPLDGSGKPACTGVGVTRPATCSAAALCQATPTGQCGAAPVSCDPCGTRGPKDTRCALSAMNTCDVSGALMSDAGAIVTCL